MESMNSPATASLERREELLLQSWGFIEELPRVRLYPEEGFFNPDFRDTFHFNYARDGVARAYQIEFLQPGGRWHVVKVGKTESHLIVRLPDKGRLRGNGPVKFWRLRRGHVIRWPTFQAMLEGRVQPALKIELTYTIINGSEYDLGTTAGGTYAAVKLGDARIPVRIENREGETAFGRHYSRIGRLITGWEAYLRCYRCLKKFPKGIIAPKVAPRAE